MSEPGLDVDVDIDFAQRRGTLGSRHNGAAFALGLLAVLLVLLTVLSIAANFSQWLGGSEMYVLLQIIGIKGIDAGRILTILAMFGQTFLSLALTSVVALLFVGAVRWQRAHAR